MGVYVDVLDEIFNRLNTATGSGLKLESVKTLIVGDRRKVLGQNNLPGAILSLTSIEESTPTTAGKMADISLSIRVQDRAPNLNEKATNLLYDTVNSVGIVYTLERVLDVLNETTSQIKDPRAGVTSNRSYSISVGEIETHDGICTCDITLVLRTNVFAHNARATS